jgi:fructose-bisphosphate aldolase class II
MSNGMTLEIELTGGEEDGVDNSDIDSSKLYTQPDEVLTKNYLK